MNNNKWAALAAGILMTTVVAGCGNKSGAANDVANGTTTPTSTSTTNFNGSDVVATVNGANVTRGDMFPLLVAASGETTLADLINQQLVMQELKKNNLEVSDAEVDEFFKERQAQSGEQATQLAKIVKDGGLRLETLKQRARLQVAIEKLVTKDVKVDAAALKTWFGKNENRYGKPALVKVGLLVAGTKVRADTMLTQLKAKSKTFAQLVGDQKNSSDPASKSSTVDVPEFPADSLGKNLGPILGPPAQKLGAGGFTPVVALGKDAFGIVSILSKTPATKADFEKLKVQAETDYKMEQVARQELAKNQKGQTLEKVIPQIEEAIMRQGQQQGNFAKPTYRELLGVLTQGKVQELQTRLRNEAKVTITDNDLKSVADKFKPSPTPVASSTANTATSNTANAAVSPAKP